MLERIHWLGHASFRINGPPHPDGPVIYIDPWRLESSAPPADIVLVSHDHHDHCSVADIELVRQPHTQVLANQRASGLIGAGTQSLRPWQGAINIEGVSIRAVPAYTHTKAFHAKVFEGLGFVITLMRHDIYYAGDTELIPEMEQIGCDIALLPVGGAFTMNFEEAAEASKLVRASISIPMHYGPEVPGSNGDGSRFCQLINESDGRAVELVPENPAFQR